MKTGTLPAAGLSLLITLSAWSDTITKKDNLSLFGTVTEMSNGVITLKARYSAGTKTLQIPIDSVQSVEFNSRTFNDGASRGLLGVGPAQSHAAKPSEVIAGDLIVLRGDDRRTCKLLSIDANRVYCNPEDKKFGPNTYGRSAVLRIQLDAK